MTEHIVAVFDSQSAADAAARDLELAGIPAPAIRRYSPAASDSSRERYAGSSTSSGGVFWAWLLGEEPTTETKRSLYRDKEFYERRAQAGETVLSVRVDDDSRIHQAVNVLEAHHPIEIEENTEEAGAAVPAEGVSGGGDAATESGGAIPPLSWDGGVDSDTSRTFHKHIALGTHFVIGLWNDIPSETGNAECRSQTVVYESP